jgi:hypothetical protein
MLGTGAALEGLLGGKPRPEAFTRWWDVTIRCRDRKWRDGILDDRPPFHFSIKVHATNADEAIKTAWKEFAEKIGPSTAQKYDVDRVEREYL